MLEEEPVDQASSLDQERQTAALAYFIFPLAFSVLLDISRQRRSEWARAHARHALFLGFGSVLLLGVLASVPLIIVSVAQLTTSAILVLYSVSFVIDLLALAALLFYALWAARAAASGESSRSYFRRN